MVKPETHDEMVSSKLSRGRDTAMQPSTLRMRFALFRVVICSLAEGLGFRIYSGRYMVWSCSHISHASAASNSCSTSLIIGYLDP